MKIVYNLGKLIGVILLCCKISPNISTVKQLITESDAEYSHVLYSYATALFLVVEDSHFDIGNDFQQI
jgi:hypothetical protein